MFRVIFLTAFLLSSLQATRASLDLPIRTQASLQEQKASAFSRERFALNNHFISSYSYSSKADQDMLSIYLGQFMYKFNERSYMDIWLGYDIAKYDPVNGFKPGEKFDWDNVKGFSLNLSTKKDFTFQIKYGENASDYMQRQRLDFFSYSSWSKENPDYLDNLDTLSVYMSKSFFNKKVNVSLLVSKPDLGLRKEP